jgi:WD40 repeat protein
MRRAWWVGAVAVVMAVSLIGEAEARPGAPHRPHEPRVPQKDRDKPKPPDDGESTDPDEPPPPTNVHLAPAERIELPGRGLTLAWSPDGSGIAAGGRFKDPLTKLRYDTRLIDVGTASVVKSFACHYWWVVATAWDDNPYLGNVVASGGGDHAVKLWRADGAGSSKCKSPGQLEAADGGLKQLGQINGWTMALAFSPDGRHLAGASRDRSIRVWQIEPGPRQFEVIAYWFDHLAGNFLSLDWSPDGKALVSGDRRDGRVAVWDFDPDTDAWDDATVAAFARLSYGQHQAWAKQRADVASREPRWEESGHERVYGARFSPDGTRVGATGTDGLLSVYDAATGAVVLRTGAPRVTGLTSFDWSPDGRWLAAGAEDHAIYVFDAESGALYDELAGHEDLVSAIAWSPDGTILASTAGGPVLSSILNEVVHGPDTAVQLWRWR